jgi:tetratricopeptide (TPR) repeat protein
MTRTPLPPAAVLALLLAMPLTAACESITRAEAVEAIAQHGAAQRLVGVARLGEIGSMADADRLVARLADDDEDVRELAAAAMWQIWSRSGDPAIDALYRRGVTQMEAAQLREALGTFSEIVRRKPAFAEGWNKRATILFLLGRNVDSLKDCDEVLKRNPNHFGALSGAAQIHLKLGDLERALEYFERALQVNPNLPGAAQAVQMLEQHLAEKRRKST